MDNLELRSKRKRENSVNVAPAVATKKRFTEATQIGTSSDVNQTSVVGTSSAVPDVDATAKKIRGLTDFPSIIAATLKNITLTSGRDTNVYISGGDLAVQEGTTILAELKALLKPVEAAYDSYVPSKNQRSRCFEGTRVRLLENIQKWVFGEGGQAPIYILDGVAGIGKTTVAQTVAELAARFNILGGSFFFSKDEDNLNIAKYFFPTLAYHLACYSDSFATEIRESLENSPDAPDKALQQQISLLIAEPLHNLLNQQNAPVLIVVDALDECDAQEAKILLALFAQHIQVLPRLRIFITARPEVHIRDVLDQDRNHERFHLHDIEDIVVETDIRLFLDFCLSVEEVKKQLPRMNPPWQPTVENKRILYGVCGKLFIIASTATKFILDNKRSDPERQLMRLLKGVSAIDFTGATRADAMDKVYMHILQSALPEDYDGDDDDDNWFDRYQAVLGAIIVLQTPLPSQALGALLGRDSNYIEGALEHLHSLVAPGGQGVVFRVHHKSFPDFITSATRIRQAFGVKEPAEGADKADHGFNFRIDAHHHHSEMGKRCLGIMECHLRRNMFNVDPVDWYLENKDIKQLQDVTIPDELTYASLYWASHIHAGGLHDQETRFSLHKWATRHLLSWLELLSVIGRFEIAYPSLEKVRRAVLGAPDWTEKNHLHELFDDAYRFIRKHGAVIRFSALHMYWSAMPFVPRGTALSGLYGKEEALNVIAGIERTWDATLATLTGDGGGVTLVVFSNDGLKLGSASYDCRIRLWNALTGAHITTLDGHENSCTALAFSNDSWRLASASLDHTARIWDGITGRHIMTLEHSSPVKSVAFSGDDSTLASASGSRVHLWDGRTGVPINVIECGSLVTELAFSGDGSRFAVLFQYHSATNYPERRVHLYICQWDTEGVGPILIDCMENSTHALFIAFSNDSSQLVAASNHGTIQIWSARTGTSIRTLQLEDNGEAADRSEPITCISFSTCGQRLASAGKLADRAIHVWDCRTGSHIARLSGHSDIVNSITYSPDSSCIASCFSDETIRIWDSQAKTPAKALYTHSLVVAAMTFSPDGLWFASASDDGDVGLWNGQTGDHIATIEAGDDLIACDLIAFSSDGTRVAWACNGHVDLWEIPSCEHIGTLEDHDAATLVESIAFSSDKSRLATGYGRGTIRVWNALTGERITTLRTYSNDRVTCIEFSPNGSWLASASDDNLNTVRLYKAVGGAFHEDSVTILQGSGNAVASITFSPDNTKLISVSYDGTMFLWEISSGVIIQSFDDDRYQSILPIFSIKELNSSYNMFILVQRRYEPYLSGIVHAHLRHSPNTSSEELVLRYEWDETPLLWFPPDLDVSTFSVSRDGSHLAVGCENGQVLLLDISQVTLPPISP